MANSRRGMDLLPNFIIMLIIGLIIYLLAMHVVSGIFRLSAQGRESFSEIMDNLNTISTNEYRSVPMNLDDKTLIVLMNPGKPESRFFTSAKGIVGPADTTLLSPPCQDGSVFPCGCLCRKVVEESGKWKCKEPECLYMKEALNLVFKPEMATSSGVSYAYASTMTSTSDGNVFERGWLNSKRTRVVYIERAGANIGICLEKPCLTADDRGIGMYGKDAWDRVVKPASLAAEMYVNCTTGIITIPGQVSFKPGFIMHVFPKAMKQYPLIEETATGKRYDFNAAVCTASALTHEELLGGTGDVILNFNQGGCCFMPVAP